MKKYLTKKNIIIVSIVIGIFIIILLISLLNQKSKNTQEETHDLLKEEGLALVESAIKAYEAESNTGENKITNTSNACFEIEWLNSKGYYDKSAVEGYYGSVLIKYNADGTYTYRFWITEGNTAYLGSHTDENNHTSYDGIVSTLADSAEAEEFTYDASLNDTKTKSFKTCGNNPMIGVVHCKDDKCISY